MGHCAVIGEALALALADALAFDLEAEVSLA